MKRITSIICAIIMFSLCAGTTKVVKFKINPNREYMAINVEGREVSYLMRRTISMSVKGLGSLGFDDYWLKKIGNSNYYFFGAILASQGDFFGLNRRFWRIDQERIELPDCYQSCYGIVKKLIAILRANMPDDDIFYKNEKITWTKKETFE